MLLFFKQKTAYELRISDGSSDVCSSDLYEVRNFYGDIVTSGTIVGATLNLGLMPLGWYRIYFIRGTAIASPWLSAGGEIGRASCRGGGCRFGWVSVVAVSINKNQHSAQAVSTGLR